MSNERLYDESGRPKRYRFSELKKGYIYKMHDVLNNRPCRWPYISFDNEVYNGCKVIRIRGFHYTEEAAEKTGRDWMKVW
jgi:hypothetical protein